MAFTSVITIDIQQLLNPGPATRARRRKHRNRDECHEILTLKKLLSAAFVQKDS